MPCYNVTEPQAPLQLSEKRNLFKLYMNDVGLLCASCMENIQFDLLMGNVEINMGSILENAFAQNLKSTSGNGSCNEGGTVGVRAKYCFLKIKY